MMVYLDNAATTFPKPSEVSGEVCRCMREYGGNPGRGAHPKRSTSAANDSPIFSVRRVRAVL